MFAVGIQIGEEEESGLPSAGKRRQRREVLISIKLHKSFAGHACETDVHNYGLVEGDWGVPRYPSVIVSLQACIGMKSYQSD